MRRAVAVVLAIGAAVPAAAAAAPTVPMMVVGPNHVLRPARNVRLRQTTVRIGHRLCKVPAGTALAGLLATRLSVQVTDVAGCDPASMFVTRIGGLHNHGLGGWEYKVEKRDPSTGAADPARRILPGQQVLWYWCVRAGACQRTLAVFIRFRPMWKIVQVTVRGYDDTGHGVGVGRALVHFGSMTAMTDRHGLASVPLKPGRYVVFATKPGLVQSFPFTVGITP